MSAVEKYLKPEVIRQISRLDLRAQFIVKGFLQGLHASPFHGFSVEFSEHRKYAPGDNPDDIDWLVYAKTDKYYIKKFEAETNLTGYLAMDLSASMAYTFNQQLTKFEYSICLAAALCYLMIHQNDPVGLVTFGEKILDSLAPKSKRQQIGNILSLLARLEPRDKTDIGRSLNQLAAMLKHSSLVMLFTDLLGEPEQVIAALRRLRHGGHDVILFHILDQAEVSFPFEGLVELEDPESHDTIEVDADAYRSVYLEEIRDFRGKYERECRQSGIDYVPLDTSMQFDRALTEYLVNRQNWGVAMGFVTPLLLAGAAFIAVPIALHLVMRRQPRKLVFPALQFVRNRREANRRRMNLRHLLLLALRCALVAGMAFALARPTLKGTGLRGKEGAPLAVALVLDNSLRMQYVEQNQTRQDRSAEMAQWLVDRLPEDAAVAVVELGRATGGFAVDLATAESRLRNLAPAPNPRPLEDAVREAVALVSERGEYRQEVFLFSDLTAAAWNESARAAIQKTLADAPEVRLYLVDVGSAEVRNVALGPLELSSSSLRPGESLRIEAPVEVVGLDEPPLVEFYLDDQQHQSVKRGQRLLELSPTGTAATTFELSDLPLGTHQGSVKIAGSDPLAVDNVRYFTVEVKPPARVLLLGVNKLDTLFLREALSPSQAPTSSPAQFECLAERYAEAAGLDFKAFDAVCLLDPPPLAGEFWQKLVDYAGGGGGVGIFLGHRAQLSGFNDSPAQQLLPGKLKLRSRYATYFRPQSLAHPVLAGFKNYQENIPWQVYPVWTYWELDDLAADAYVAARYANNRPALMERPVGRGRVITLTTPVSDPLDPSGREPWNLLPTGPEPWPFLALANQLVGYLAQHDAEGLSYFAGETVNLRLSPTERLTGYVLHQPGGQSQRRTLPSGGDAIRIGATSKLGNYRVAAGGKAGALDRGFSVNPPADVSHLQRVEPDSLTELFPAGQVEIAATLDDVERYVDIGRSGRELFPWVICLVALVWSAENLLANRFYREAA